MIKNREKLAEKKNAEERARTDGLRLQVIREYEMGASYVKPKRDQYAERIENRNPQRKKKKKVLNINMISEAIDVAVSVSYSDALSVRFVSRDGFLHQEQADKLQYVAEFDSQEAHYQQIKYQSERDRHFYGVSIRFNE